ncbi:MAG: hypothetical protein AAF291_11720 [Pseudomonadota bacterium]
MGFYVNLEDVNDLQLAIAGFVLVSDNEQFRVYRHLGEDVIVDKSDPFVVVDDINDAAVLGSEIVPMPPED